ncbi:MAG: MFS transporter [Acidobacteria bacterium]|nr:MAG: MFS transporter [Acidobacteriota bacterium]
MEISKNILKNDRKEIFGWLMYDWANSAFYTTVIGVLLGPYLTALAQADVGERGVVLSLGPIGDLTAEALVPAALGISVAAQVILLPVLGSIADYTHLKKPMMAFFCYLGVTASSLLFFVSEGHDYLWGCFLMIIANMSFAAANVFYNAFLVDITTEENRDKISSYGFAYGYVSGIVMLIVNLATIQYSDQLGISKSFAVRLSMLLASLWWGVFALVTFALLKPRKPPLEKPKDRPLLIIGFTELWKTCKELKNLKQTTLFLMAYLFYNDGIQTVILNSSVFLSQELFDEEGRKSNQSFLLAIFFVAQVAALIGSLFFERVSRILGTKRTILVCLTTWCAVVIYAYAFLTSTYQAWIMSSLIGLVLGSTQALSRSLYSQMIPIGRESSFFGLYEISEKGTSWLGQLIFAAVVNTTGSYRQAILALIVFFFVGGTILLFTDVEKGVEEAEKAEAILEQA